MNHLSAITPAWAGHLMRAGVRPAPIATILGCLLGLLLLVGRPAPISAQVTTAQTSVDIPERGSNPDARTYDRAGVLAASQEDALDGDMARARTLGIEMLVYTRRSMDSPQQSQAFADQLRAQWGVESSPGADDGIVYLLTVNPADADSSAVVVSTGANTLPIRQLDQAALQQVVDDDMAPRVADGDFADALYFGVRRVLNFAEYSPPDPPPLTDRQESLNKAAAILAAILLQVTVIGYFLAPVVRERRITLLPEPRTLALYAIVVGALGVIVGVIAIAGRHTLGSLMALAAVIIAGGVVPLLIEWSARRRVRVRTSKVSPHGNMPVKARHPESAIGSLHG